MKNGLKSISTFLLSSSLIVVLLGGCNAANRTTPSPNGTANTQLEQVMPGTSVRPGTIAPRTFPRDVTMPNAQNYPGITRVEQEITRTAGFDTKRAENITRKLNNMKEFERVHTVVYGNTALVGFKTAGNVKDIAAAKNLVINTVRKIDNSVTNISASDSGDIMTKLTQLTKDIQAGKPANDLTNRFNQLIQTITPAAS